MGSSDDSSSNHELFPGLGQVKIVDTILVALVDVVDHLFGNVLGTNVNLNKLNENKIKFKISYLSGNHVDEVVFFVLGVKNGHFILEKKVIIITSCGLITI